MTTTEYEMQATHLRRKLAEAEQRLRMLKEDGHVTDAERRVLDMWPRFEDGEPVMLWDEALDKNGDAFEVGRIEVKGSAWMLNDSPSGGHYLNGRWSKRVKRPAPEVLDADGAPIRVGDALRHLCGGSRVTVTEVRPDGLVRARRPDGGESLLLSERLTRREPDSWERLEEDATMAPFSYCAKRGIEVECDDGEFAPTNEAFVLDIVRRAKALAGIGVE